ncbi:hypothetical protein [Pseudaminobacter soli (ex Li et al. 2025)]|uniref:hypothetical protein n=1 Tax=Pseudaminobacter soli (ex Li et al. 2025) TaxID=1295366 RepID=UPI0015E6A44D|nr:hypothetical protein [Mesorhizobium soli]
MNPKPDPERDDGYRRWPYWIMLGIVAVFIVWALLSMGGDRMSAVTKSGDVPQRVE